MKKRSIACYIFGTVKIEKRRSWEIIKNESGISPMVGALLMILIMFILALTVLVFSSTFNEKTDDIPRSAVMAKNNGDTTGMIDILIAHKGGDSFKGGWAISVVRVGQSPSFKRSGDVFSVGDVIHTMTETSGNGNYTVTNTGITTDSPVPLISGERYNVKMILYPNQAVIHDEIVDVR